MLLQSQPIAHREDVRLTDPERQLLCLAVLLPAHEAFANVELRALRDIVDFGEIPIDRIAFRLDLGAISQQRHSLIKGRLLQRHRAVGIEILPENIRRIGNRSAGVLFLGQAEKIGREADLSFDFLFAIAK